MLRDICRADGPPTSQPELLRLPGQEREVNIFLREATRRLQQPAQRTRRLTTNPKTPSPSPKPEPKPKPKPNQAASGRGGRDMGRRGHIPGGPAAGAPNLNPDPNPSPSPSPNPNPKPNPNPCT